VVVHATEEAANRIMEAEEAIGDWLRDGKHDTASREIVNEKVNAIFEACSLRMSASGSGGRSGTCNRSSTC
jgi:hypothetical protein